MRRLRAATILYLLALASPQLFGCSCTPHEPGDDMLRAKSVYFARLVSAREIKPSGDDVLGHYEVTF
jgi:hypothetical protein